jgi:hypothetical protein
VNLKLKENIWRLDMEKQTAILIASGQAFSVPFDPALVFMKIRPYCTGYHSVADLAERTEIPEESLSQLVNSLKPSGIFMDPVHDGVDLSTSRVRSSVLSIVHAWSLELSSAYIGNELGQGRHSRQVLVGWLLEMYHYIKNFPSAIEAARRAAPPGLADIYARYCKEETGHEIFVLRTLEKLGLSADEVKNSVPLVSTRSIGLLMRNLFEEEPIALLIVAALVEAQEFNDAAIAHFKEALAQHYRVPDNALDAYFEHQRIDVALGHADLLQSNIAWLDLLGEASLDRILDGVHDIKHAFELQSLEIVNYYGVLNGKYFPRQPMSYAAIC